MERHELTPVVEALLFAADEPLTIAAIRKVIESLTAAEVRDILDTLKLEYEDPARGIGLMEIAGGFVFVTKESCAGWVEKMMKGKRRVRLSRASLETVAVIAYKQPIGRGEIERIRGVDAGGVLATLLERDLIMIKGRDSGPGKPLLYGTTQEFLNYFGLNKVSDLPRLDELSTLAAQSPAWSDAERARMEKAGLDPIEFEGRQPGDLAHAGGEDDPLEAAPAETPVDVMEETLSPETGSSEDLREARDEADEPSDDQGFEEPAART